MNEGQPASKSSDRPGVGISARHGIIPALDPDDVEAIKRVVTATTRIEGVVAYKLGLTMVLQEGLFGAVEILRRETDLPLIYDHQKAGCDIPTMGPKFAKLCKSAGVDGLILFPVAGPLVVDEFVGGALENDVTPIVGGDLPFPSYNAAGGGYVIDDALDKIFVRSIEVGCDHFVVPAADAEKVRHHADRLRERVAEPKLFLPGIGALGGAIGDTFGAAPGCHRYAIIGRGIYGADDPAEAANAFAGEALSFD